MKQMKQKNPQKNPFYYCEKCNFESANKKDYNRHLLTSKHQNETNETDFETKKPIKTHLHNCEKCSVQFKSRTSLWRHKQQCVGQNLTEQTSENAQQKDLDKQTKNNILEFDSEGNRIIYKTNNILLQKWNNIIINYSGGTFDVFLNGELVKSSIEVVPYYTYENLTIGENNGIKGGICNVVYFRHSLTSSNIYYLYNTLKNRAPPTLNDSNETILKNNINTVKNSNHAIINKLNLS
jgi:hypothetical protein